MPPVLLAHGALGAFDEIIFISIAAIFLGIMAVSWVKSRNTEPELAEFDDTEWQHHDHPLRQSDPGDRFQLD